MNYIDRLLMKARKAMSGSGMHVLGFIQYSQEKQKYTASITVWDGVPGSGGERIDSEHDTKEDALAACESVAARYPNADNLNFIIDYGLED